MDNTFSTISPIDGSIYVERAYADPHDIQVVIDNARTAQQGWKRVALTERKALCSRAIDRFIAKKAEDFIRQQG